MHVHFDERKCFNFHTLEARMLHKNTSWKCSGMQIRVLLQKWKFIPSYFHSFWPSGHYQSDIMNAPLIHSMPIVTAYSFNILLDFLRRNILANRYWVFKNLILVILVKIQFYFMTLDVFFKVCSSIIFCFPYSINLYCTMYILISLFFHQ